MGLANETGGEEWMLSGLKDERWRRFPYTNRLIT
jgi:hypothetical protein